MEFKIDVVKYAKQNSNNNAAKNSKVDRKRIREWVQNGNKLLPMKRSRCRFHGGGQKLTDAELEEQVLSWIHERCAHMLHVSRKIIMFQAKSIYDEK